MIYAITLGVGMSVFVFSWREHTYILCCRRRMGGGEGDIGGVCSGGNRLGGDLRIYV